MVTRKLRTETRNDGGGDYLVIHQPNVLRAKVGRVSVDPAALERAEAALEALSSTYPEELTRNARGVEALWASWRAAPDEEGKLRLVMLVHDIKGQAGSLGYPLATEVARSLGIVLKLDAQRIAGLQPVVDAHIGAIKAIAAQRISGDGGATGRDLIEGLRTILGKFGLDPNDGLTA
jgi:hypothetical protein